MKNFTLLGIDGGATKVSVWEIEHNPDSDSFALGTLNSEKKYSDIPRFIPSFKPVDIKEQFSTRGELQKSTTIDEQQMETVYVEACYQAINDVYNNTHKKPVLLGIGMPGLKTADKRGIEVVANGPRMISYSILLEERLKSKRIELAAPIFQIGSDADYCGIGENYAENGAFKNIENGYYLGGGTGVADALKLDNRLYPFDAVKEWMAKSWELKSSEGRSVERYCSAGGIQSIYAEFSKRDINDLTENNIYPLQIALLAQQGNEAAVETYKRVAENLARLLFSRISTLNIGWQNDFEFMNPARAALSKTHGRLGKVYNKIIIGQRLAELMNTETGGNVLRKPMLEKLLELIGSNSSLSSEVKKYYTNLNEILVTSSLREAPALGAGIDAYLNWKENN